MTDDMNKATARPWQLCCGDLDDHGEDGDANGFTILMGGARVAKMPSDEVPSAGAERIGRRLAIHEIRYAEDVFPEDAGREEAEANARLIVAAVNAWDERAELLAALREAGAALRVNALRSGISHAEIDAHPVMQRIAALTKAEERG